MIIYDFGVCPMDNCITRKEPPKATDKPGRICYECGKALNKHTVQAVRCKLCGRMYYLRDRLYIYEKKYVQMGLCVWCKERLKWEKEQYEQGFLSKEELTKYASEKYFNIIANEDINIPSEDYIYLFENTKVNNDGELIENKKETENFENEEEKTDNFD